ncbi:MAG: glycosyltransferase family 2 protein [Janthinobacterium lividum]
MTQHNNGSSLPGEPRLSIIIPTYNSGETIVRCLQSIEMQVFQDYEIVVQDGRSTDQTLKLVADFHQAHPHRTIRCAQETDSGVYDAMNKAMQRAKGRWLYFLGSDDELFSRNCLQEVLGTEYSEEVGVLYGNVRMVDLSCSPQKNSLYDGPFTLKKLLSRNICHQSMFYRKELTERVGFYDPKYKTWADWDYNVRSWSCALFRYVDVTVANFHLGGLSSQDGGTDKQFLADVTKKVMSLFHLSGLSPLVNTKTFVGWEDVNQLQRQKSFAYYTLANTLRTSRNIYERLVKKLTGRNR